LSSTITLGHTDLEVFKLCLGGNVFGWTADEAQSFAVLDAYLAAGGNFIDTADSYSAFAPGNVGGESETVLGRWMRARGNRDQIVLATKVGKKPGLEGLAPATIRTALQESLERLGTDYIDLYYAHADDEQTPLEDSLEALDALVKEGTVRYIAASNYTAPRLEAALQISQRDGLAGYVAIQPQYSLVERTEYEGALADLSQSAGLACLPYWGLARGFLTGKYRAGAEVDSPRARAASHYQTDAGYRLLDVVDEVAAHHQTTVAAVALAWLAAQPAVAAPLASARTPEQLAEILPAAELELSEAEISRLTDATAQSAAGRG
jgi:aryl-alcohol dehydrogenase-like predicted oxidoreductase